MDAGKAVYCEKPMTHTIPEAQAVMKKQKDNGRPLRRCIKQCLTTLHHAARDRSVRGSSERSFKPRLNTSAGTMRRPVRGEFLRKSCSCGKADGPRHWNAWLGSAEKRDWNPHPTLNGDVIRLFRWHLYRPVHPPNHTNHASLRPALSTTSLRVGGIWQWPDGRDLPTTSK